GPRKRLENAANARSSACSDGTALGGGAPVCARLTAALAGTISAAINAAMRAAASDAPIDDERLTARRSTPRLTRSRQRVAGTGIALPRSVKVSGMLGAGLALGLPVPNAVGSSREP